MTCAVQTGLARVLAGDVRLPPTARLGLLCHGASVGPGLEAAFVALPRQGCARFAALFAPEHGLWGTHQDMEGVPDEIEPMSGLPVHSLYGSAEASLEPTAAALAGLDGLVVDLQDIGCRYYTFAYSLDHALVACARLGLAVFVLDRPNPLGGLHTEGNVVEPACRSFVGRHALPVRHGLTLGELARFFAAERGLDVDLTVVPLRGWQRAAWFDETGLPWVAPSPNMPTLQTAAVYPGMCLIEGTNVSEGRGTTHPFEWFGAPFVDPFGLVERLEALGVPGARFRATRFRPTFHKYAGQVCGGAEVHVVDRQAFRPLRLGLAALKALHDLWPRHFAWRTEPYEFRSDRLAIDLLAGTASWREAIENGASLDDIEAANERAALPFTARHKTLWLYPGQSQTARRGGRRRV